MKVGGLMGADKRLHDHLSSTICLKKKKRINELMNQ